LAADCVRRCQLGPKEVEALNLIINIIGSECTEKSRAEQTVAKTGRKLAGTITELRHRKSYALRASTSRYSKCLYSKIIK